jgi:hypothetical protein
MRLMRGSVAVVAFAAAAAVSTASPAVAISQKLVVGHAVGSAPFDFEGCDFVHQQFLATIDTPGAGDASLHVDTCVDFGGAPFSAAGTFTLVTTEETLSGTATGTIMSGDPVRFAFTLVVDDQPDIVGQGSTLYFRGVWKSVVDFGGPIRGRLGTQAP